MTSRLEVDGYEVVAGALSPAEVDRLTNAVDRVYRELVDAGPLHELAFLRHDDRFLELVDHPATLPLVCGALGTNIHMYHCHLDVHPPQGADEPTRWRWHQDGGVQNVELATPRPLLSVKVAYFLTDVTSPEDGCLWLLPGSHRRETLARPADGSPHPPWAKPLLVSAGTAAVLDRRIWHARGDNRSGRTRKALFYAYTHRWIRPRDDLRLEPDRIAALTPIRRQLLGWATGTTGHWLPTEEDVPLRRLNVR